MAYVPVIGKQYNHYTVISEEIKKSADNKRMFHVRCSCGKEEFKRAQHLETGRCKSCKSCASKRTSIKSPPPLMFKGVGDLSKTYYSAIRNGALLRDLEFNVTLDFLWELLESQNFRCALTGVPINLSRKIKDSNVDYSDFTASLDRIDNTKGYVRDNVWWVHRTVNRLKNNYSVDELKYWCKLILSHDNPEPSSVNGISNREGATTNG